ncbi:MAG: 7-cyano-7-deazaguanine synthase QueC [Desulfovibrionaceae bacterium]|nr:7-cyano-7-deazaguanine synthase QueC [Desulfovibrionaceae bacterium]
MNKCVVLFSGGQDSTTCLLYALKNFGSVFTLGFSYGQRHSQELDCRQDILAQIRQNKPELARKLESDFVCDVTTLSSLTSSALTSDRPIERVGDSLPTSFVPARNLIFLSLAGSFAYEHDVQTIIMGVSQVDYSGYPDCREPAIKSMAQSLTLGLDRPMEILTPLMSLSKADTFSLAMSLAGSWGLDLIVEHTLSCYLGDMSHKNSWGYGCGKCPACVLRCHGYEEFVAKTSTNALT